MTELVVAAKPSRSARNRLNRKLRLGESSGWLCVYCGCRLWLHTLTTDHIIPKRRGGKHVPDNTLPSCGPCNVAKGDGRVMRFVPAARLSPQPEPKETPMPAIFITGPAGSGKTTNAAALARHYGKTVILDEWTPQDGPPPGNALVIVDGGATVPGAIAIADAARGLHPAVRRHRGAALTARPAVLP